MPAVPCTGALRRKLPTGHPSMAGCRGTSPHEALEARGDTGSLPTACRTSRVQRRDVIQRVQGDPPLGVFAQGVLRRRRPREPVREGVDRLGSATAHVTRAW